MIEGPSLVPLLDNLEANGLVERTEDPNDRRCKIIRMTTEGQKIYRQTAEISGKVLGRLMRGISDDELALCHDVFDRFEAALAAAKSHGRA